MLSQFDYYGHFCIVFECLGLSVEDYMREQKNKPLPMSEVQNISFQLVFGVKCKFFFTYMFLYTNFLIFLYRFEQHRNCAHGFEACQYPACGFPNTSLGRRFDFSGSNRYQNRRFRVGSIWNPAIYHRAAST